MRALILVAGAALAVSACSSNEAAENTMNVDETLTTENVVANDTTAIDASTAMDANMTMDANATDANATDANATTERPVIRRVRAALCGLRYFGRGRRLVRRPFFYLRPTTLCACSVSRHLRPLHRQRDRRIVGRLPRRRSPSAGPGNGRSPSLRGRPGRCPAAARPASARCPTAGRPRSPPWG